MSNNIEATEAAAPKPMTRAECLVALTAAGYEGPTSYLMPKLRDIVRHEAAGWTDADDVAVKKEADRLRKNAAARARRAAKKLEAASA